VEIDLVEKVLIHQGEVLTLNRFSGDDPVGRILLWNIIMKELEFK
jgi:hypothetical protein